jgi:hypothetical protein
MTAPTGSAGAPRERPDVEDLSVGDLLGNVTRDFSTLMRQEVSLAKAEIRAEAGKAGKGAGMMAGAGMAAWLCVLFASLAVWGALANVMDEGLAALIVAVLWAVAGAVLYSTGRRTLRAMNPTPERTVDTMKQVPDALKGNMS